MDNNKKYNLFLLTSTFSRSLVEVFNIALLYKLSYSLKEILLYYTVFMFLSALVNFITINLTNHLKPKYILIFSNAIFCLSYLYLNIMNYTLINLIIFACFSSLSSYSYHLVRHYYAIKFTDKTNKEIGSIIIFSYLGIILASYIGTYITESYSLSSNVILIFIFSLISIIPLLSIKENVCYEKIEKIKIDKNRLLFFILEQSKVLFLVFEPLYLYLYISKDLKYIGIFNIVSLIASIIFVKLIVKKNIEKYFKYLNSFLIIILLLKLNITNKYLILLIAFFEGLFMKVYEVVSMKNFYQVDENIKSYLLISEITFCFSQSLFCLIFYLFIDNIKIILYTLLIFIFLSGILKKFD